jgi:hypothetical protein
VTRTHSRYLVEVGTTVHIPLISFLKSPLAVQFLWGALLWDFPQEAFVLMAHNRLQFQTDFRALKQSPHPKAAGKSISCLFAVISTHMPAEIHPNPGKKKEDGDDPDSPIGVLKEMKQLLFNAEGAFF